MSGTRHHGLGMGLHRLAGAAALMLVTGACHTPLQIHKVDARAPMPLGDANGGGSPADGAQSVDGQGSGGTGGPGTSADAVRVCTYVASGQDRAVSVFRDQARTVYTLVSRLFANPIVQPIGTESDRLFSYEFERNHTLYARTLANGLLRFVDVRVESDGPGWSFDSLCSADGIQFSHPPRDPQVHLELMRADDTSYRVDMSEWWTVGRYPIRFYAAPEGATTTTELGTAIEVVSRNPDGSANVSFTDLDGRQVSIDITSYSVLTAIRIVSP